MIPSGPKAPSVCTVSLLAAKLKLTVVLLHLLHLLLDGHCATPREPRTLLVIGVHMASIAVGVLLQLANVVEGTLVIGYSHIGATITSGLYVRERIAFGEHSPYAEGARHRLLRTS